MGETTLTVQNVVKRYGDFVAVDNISFDVKSGRIFGFLGPNGAGKTTTIRMIVNITMPDEGEIKLFGEHINPKLQDRIGYLPEERGLYKKLKIFEQLRYFASLKGISTKEADKKIDWWLERVGLEKWKAKKTTDLSKGMQQKVQFVSAILHNPDLIILDEPFSGLDPLNVKTLIDIIADLKKEGKTIIFSTHLMETAEKLCDDIILINKSKKVLGGSLREVKESFGKNLLALRCSGGEKVFEDKSLVVDIKELADEKVLVIGKKEDADKILKKLVESGAQVTKFEMIEPSLNDIFISQVAGENE